MTQNADHDPDHRPDHRTGRLLLVLLLACLALAGCGGGGDDGSDDTGSAGDDGSGSSSMTLRHVEGEIGMHEDGDLLVTRGDEPPLKMELGPAVQLGEVQALAAAGSRARVYYVDDDGPVAAKVEPAASEVELPSYQGLIVKVSATSITLDGDDGERTFAILPADAAAFELDHLREHAAENEPITVYFRSDGGTDRAVSYEDA